MSTLVTTRLKPTELFCCTQKIATTTKTAFWAQQIKQSNKHSEKKYKKHKKVTKTNNKFHKIIKAGVFKEIDGKE